LSARSSREAIIVPISMICVLVALAVVSSSLRLAHSPVQASTGGRAGFNSLTDQPTDFQFLYRGGDRPVQVLIDTNPAGSAGFRVYNDQQWQLLLAGDSSAVPLGDGAPDPNAANALSWQGSAAEAGRYHIRVFRLSDPATFWIKVLGDGASDLLPAAQPTAVPEVATPALAVSATLQPPAPEPTAPPTVVLVPASRPATAAPLMAKPTIRVAPTPTRDIASAQRALTGAGSFNVLTDDPMEFDFRYRGGNQLVKVMVEAKPADSVVFNVYTDDQWNLLAGGVLSVQPIGRGTANPHEPGSLFWQGASQMPGLYHIQVARVSRPASFWITLAGPGANDLISLSPAAQEP
jgi:hypothetical protein